GTIGRSGSLTYHEGNYADRVGWREITAAGANGEAVSRSSAPTHAISDTLLRYPKALLSSPLRVTDAILRFASGASGAAPGFPNGGAEGARPLITGGAFAKLATWSGVTAWVFLLAILLAMGFGAMHALLPGHGKTIMAAYLVGAGGKIRQAAQVGIAVARMHTFSVLALGIGVFVLAQFAPDQAYPWITLASGIVVVGLGVGLLVTRLRNRSVSGPHDHGHEPHRHPHVVPLPDRELVPAVVGAGALVPAPVIPIRQHVVHANGNGLAHPAPELDKPLTKKRLIGLAAAGGI